MKLKIKNGKYCVIKDDGKAKYFDNEADALIYMSPLTDLVDVEDRAEVEPIAEEVPSHLDFGYDVER